MTKWFGASILATIIAWVSWLGMSLYGDAFPEKVPIHWNINMDADGWASGAAAMRWLLVMPAMMTFLLGLNWLLPRCSPAAFRDAGTRLRFDFALFASLGFFLTISALLVVAMRTGDGDFPIRPFFGAAFVLFGLIGGAMRGLKPNPWMGVRVPWTMNDERVWTKTHNFAATLWVATGVIGLIAIMAGLPPLVCLVLLLPAILAPLVAAYFFSRPAPPKPM